MLDQSAQRFADTFHRAVTWSIVKQLLGFGEAAIRAMRQVVPGLLRFFGRDRGSILFPRDKSQARGLAKPGSQGSRKTPHRHRRWGDHMEAFAHRGIPVGNRLHEGLRHIVRVNVMQRLQPLVWHQQFFSPGKFAVHFKAASAQRTQRHPARSHDVTGQYGGCRETAKLGLFYEIGFELRFLDAVLAKRTTRQVFRHGDGNGVAVDPDGPATDEMAYLPAQGLHQLPGGSSIKTDHVNDNVRLEPTHVRTECTGGIFRLAVHDDLLHFLPCWVGQVGLGFSSVDANHLVALVYQSRDEKRSYMTRSTNHHNAHLYTPAQSGISILQGVSSGGPAAIDQDGVPGDQRRGWRGEKD